MKRLAALTSLLLVFCLLVRPGPLEAQQPAAPPPGADIVEILADTQQKVGDLYILRGHVEVRYRGTTLTADEITYNEKTRIVEARGQVVFEREDDRLEASEAHYNLATGEGVFLQVEGTVGVPPRATTDYLVTTNPFYFKAERVERHRDGSYLVERGWVTNCRPGRPKWRLTAARARIRPGDDVRLYRSAFLLGGVPILYSPYAAISIADRPRQSGFLWPSIGNDSLRGTTIGDAYFWALNPHADLTVGAQFFNQGGWTQSADFRALPTTTTVIEARYFGAEATKLRRTLERDRGIGVDQSGQSATVFATSQLPHGFRAVADLNHLSSFRFRLGFAPTFNEAVRSEVHADAFITNNPDTFYFNGFFHRYQNFFRPEPETSVTLLAAPAFEFGTRARRLPWFGEHNIYFRFDSYAGGYRRDEPRFKTPQLVQRFELYPRVTVPLRLGYFWLTPTFGVRASRYSSRVVDDPSQPGGKLVLNRPLRRITEEVSLNLRFPALARIFERPAHHYKHVIEPEVTYRYVNGVRSFEEFLRFDDHDILTDTHEIEYSVTQRLYRRERDEAGQAEELVSWRVSQKYYFNHDFGGALRPERRNVLEALSSLTPFAFADGLRRFSPIVSTVKVTPGERYDTDFRVDYDTERHRIANTRLSVTTRLTELIRFSVSHFTTRNREVLQPRSNQVRLLASYGALNRQGFNSAFAITWDAKRDFLPNTVVQTSYNWDCCGVAFSYRRLGLGPLRSQNEFRFTFTVANVGTFGTIREQERLF
ncbi:MAG: LPS-assembly protein LptD [Acidobacteria bacterium]|nr:LPS-assembly protein LptD [Acidobacteriota bacterium]